LYAEEASLVFGRIKMKLSGKRIGFGATLNIVKLTERYDRIGYISLFVKKKIIKNIT